MSNKSPAEIAYHLNALYNTAFDNKSCGNYSLSKESFRSLSGRSRLEAGHIRKVADELLETHGIVLIELNDSFCITLESLLLKWRKVPKGVLSKQAKRRIDLAPTKSKTVVSPTAAWPFPTGTRKA
ncbi:hypothetical protein [Undibacterium sp. Xuan67W]|uniref:hypothetical protein n=1 Tax=Undibacterium sp. Xuan67W TaxID=3413057 RepID=UPI003BF03346